MVVPSFVETAFTSRVDYDAWVASGAPPGAAAARAVMAAYWAGDDRWSREHPAEVIKALSREVPPRPRPAMRPTPAPTPRPQLALAEDGEEFAAAMDDIDPLRAIRERFSVPKRRNSGKDAAYMCGNSLGRPPLLRAGRRRRRALSERTPLTLQG